MNAPRTRVRPAPARVVPNPEPAAPAIPAADPANGQVAWHRLRSTRGWTSESVSLLMYEFIQSRGLFNELVAFAKTR